MENNLKPEKKKRLGLFKTISVAAEKAGNTVEKVGQDLKSTTTKIEEVLDDSNTNVKNVLEIVTVIVVGGTLLNLLATGIMIFSRGSVKNSKPPIIIHNLNIRQL